MNRRIQVIRGNIVAQEVDAIVNAANGSLLGGGGVDGAIHRAAGPELYVECQKLKGCATSEAKITGGYRLPAKYVIHTVGPIWKGGVRGENEKLAQCYRNVLALAEQHGVHSIAFPAISTGAYGFPVKQAAYIAVSEAAAFLTRNSTMKVVKFICFDKEAFEIYLQMVADLGGLK